MSYKMVAGNEAVAFGAMQAGVALVAGYPGTPSTEILETVAKANDGTIYVEWSTNEKAALEVAAGAAFSGARAMVTMKQVGLNVASDPLMSLNYLHLEGGLVIAVCDDPAPGSSQTEQDTRHFGVFGKFPVFDPSSPEEAYSMVQTAFEISEAIHAPVILRPATRICHSSSSFDVPDTFEVRKPAGYTKNLGHVIFPKRTFDMKPVIENRLVELGRQLSCSPYNFVLTGGAEATSVASTKGIACGGVAYACVREALAQLETEYELPAYRVLKVGTPNPFPAPLAYDELLTRTQEILCFEELDPVIERELLILTGKSHVSNTIRGKLSGDIANVGATTTESVRKALISYFNLTEITSGSNTNSTVLAASPSANSTEITSGSNGNSTQIASGSNTKDAGEDASAEPTLYNRPPVLCAGCPHRASFYAVKRAMHGVPSVFCGDIGCYTLGNAQPLDMVDTCICMGADITVAQGIKHMNPELKCFSFIGDSTFFASGITGITNAVYNQANIVVCVLDNSTTAMTGHQPHPGIGRTMMGNTHPGIDIAGVLKACGVSFVKTVDPYNLELAITTVKEAANVDGVSAIIFKAPCAALIKPAPLPRVTDACRKCRKCVRDLGCPALSCDPTGHAVIDTSLCYGCNLCASVCPFDAIEVAAGATPALASSATEGGAHE